MNINVSVIDLRVKKIAEQYKLDIQQQLNTTKQDEQFLISTAFVLLCIHTILDIPLSEAVNYLTEGGNDAGVDGLHVGELQDEEFTITVFQGKYKHNLDNVAHFPENSIIKLLITLKAFLDPDLVLRVNPQLQLQIEEIRSLIRDSYFPRVRVMLCNNGLPWKQEAQQYIDATQFGNQISWFHINHDRLVELLQNPKSVNERVQLVGEAIVDELNYRRVLIGKISVNEIKMLFDRYGHLLLVQNIRRYLGLHRNRVNQEIRESLLDPDKRANFYFYNNGITMICSHFRYNALQHKNYSVKVDNLQIINGGQTCITINETLNEYPDEDFETAFVLLRLYELENLDQEVVYEITKATNSQNPVDLRDLRANDDIQRQLEITVQELGYQYKRKRNAINGSSTIIPSTIAAKAILAIWRRKPHLIQFREREIFGLFYEEIFSDHLNATQLLIAVLILRMVDKERKHHTQNDNAPAFLPYASYFLAMLIGEALLKQQGITFSELDHRCFEQTKTLFENSHQVLYQQAIDKLEMAIHQMYGNQEISLQRLSATFRRGDLLEILNAG